MTTTEQVPGFEIAESPTKQLRAFDTKMTPDVKKRHISAVVSTAIVDHDGEVLLPSGMDKSVFNDNPSFLLYHNQEEWPLGLWDASTVMQRSNGIVGEADYAERPPSHLLPITEKWMPDLALWYTHLKILKGLSVGFIPVDRRAPTPRDKQMFGHECKCVTTKWQLLEISLCNTPTNRDALISAVSKGLVQKSLLTEFWEISTKGKKSQILVDSTPLADRRLVIKQPDKPTLRLGCSK